MAKISRSGLEIFVKSVKRELKNRGIDVSDGDRPFSDEELKTVKQVINRKLKEKV
jgi:hypothetical protein